MRSCNFPILFYCWHISYSWSLQTCPTICNPIDCNRSDSSVHGVLQARILEWVAMLSSRGSSQPRDWTQLSFCLLHWQVSSLSLAPPGKPLVSILETLKQIWDNPSTSQTTGLNFLGCQEARDRPKVCETLSAFSSWLRTSFGQWHTELLGKEIEHIFCMRVSLVKSIVHSSCFL